MIRLIVLVLLAAVAGCGIATQPRPEPVPVPPDVGALPRVPPGESELWIYFVRDERVAPARRTAPARTAENALALLAAGPTPDEAAAGLDTALLPQPLSAATSPVGGTLVVDATDALARVSGRRQLLAVAQLVWTLTELPGVERILVRIDRGPIELPTDDGLSAAPVGRDDYRTVAPAG